jgi:hypothetical protein
VNKLVLAASLVAALILSACGASTPTPSQTPASPVPSQPTVSASPASPSPSTPSDPATPEPPATPVPTVKPTPKPTPKPVSFSRAERYLVDGILRGESDCSPVRGDALPGLAIAGIDCDLIGTPVARMGFYLFKNDDDMLDAYMARVSVENLIVDSGACVPGEGEGAYIPYGDDEFAPDRHACYVNDEGYGNYRATLSGVHVYVGLLGRSANMRSLEDWAWFGNQDTPGNPTLWGQGHVYRP